MRRGAAESLGSAFPSIPDEYKNQAWQDLHRLTADQDSYVRQGAARSLGSAFPTIPDEYKNQAWQDLIRLTADQKSEVRVYAYHSLGRACVFKATAAAEDKAFQENLEKAIEFFEKSSQEAKYYNPAEFCLPFYRSFFAVTFQEAGSQEQVNRYLAEAKGAVAGSKSQDAATRGSREPLPSAARGPPGQRTPGSASCPGGLSAILRPRRQSCWTRRKVVAPGASKVVRRGCPSSISK